MGRDAILHRVRTALGRSPGQAAPPPPPVRLGIPEMSMEERITRFRAAIEKLAGKTAVASDAGEVRAFAEQLIAGRTAVASNAPMLMRCGIGGLAGVETGFTDREALRAACAVTAVGITSADYALADTGTLVMISSREEARLISLLPPAHLAIVPRERLLTGLDELLSILPHPAEQTSSMVLITGPSRTADIEQILVRGVHGPGEIHVVVL